MLVGPDGSGKSQLVDRLIHGKIHNKHAGVDISDIYKKRFYASTHYTNEALSIYSAAGRFFTNSLGNFNIAVRLKKALQEDKFLFVMGGLERLLKPVSFDRGVIPLGTYSSILMEGYAANWDTSNLFRILNIISRKGKSHIVLTSSIIPIELKNRLSSIKIVRIKGICLEEVKTVFGNLIDRKWANEIPSNENLKSREIIGEIYTSLNGHSYLLTLLFHALSGFELTQDPRQWLSKLSNELSATVPERRANLVVGASIRIVTKDNKNDAPLAIEILEHLSMFTTPVDINAIMMTCAKGEYTIQQVEKYVTQLEKANLVFKVCPLPNEPNSLVRYSIHSIIRRYNRYRFGNLADSPAEPNLIDLSNLETKPDKDHVYTPYATSTIGIAIDKLIAETGYPLDVSRSYIECFLI